MKEYLDFEDGEIKKEENGTFIDEDREIIEENKEENLINIENSFSYNNEENDIVDENYYKILKVSDKKFVDGNYNYKDDTKQEKPKKIKKIKEQKEKKEKKEISIAKGINKILSFVLFICRIAFASCIIIFIYLMVLYGAMLLEEEEIELSKEEENIVQIEQVVENAKQENSETSLGEYISLKESINKYLSSLNEIINGEIVIINNLEKGIITSKDAYTYFSKTFTKKDEMLKDLQNQNFPEELGMIYNSLILITTRARTNSKTIMNDHLLGKNNSTIIYDMGDFYTKYSEELETINTYLSYIQ